MIQTRANWRHLFWAIKHAYLYPLSVVNTGPLWCWCEPRRRCLICFRIFCHRNAVISALIETNRLRGDLFNLFEIYNVLLIWREFVPLHREWGAHGGDQAVSSPLYQEFIILFKSSSTLPRWCYLQYKHREESRWNFGRTRELVYRASKTGRQKYYTATLICSQWNN